MRMLMLTAVGIIALLAGCATTAQAPSGAQTFAGQVWTWDERDSTVTLMQDGGQRVRVKVTPEQLRTLRLHERTRVTGTPAPPADLVIASPSGPMTAVPKGQPAIVELKGTVTSADPDGRVAVNSDRGAVRVWAASGADQRFQKGAPVTVWMSVQPVDLVPGTPATPSSRAASSASTRAACWSWSRRWVRSRCSRPTAPATRWGIRSRSARPSGAPDQSLGGALR